MHSYLKQIIFILIILSSHSVFPENTAGENTVIYYFYRMPFFGTPDTQNEGIIISLTKMVFE